MKHRAIHQFAAAAALAAAFLVPSISRADMFSPPPPECVDHPPGTQCILDNGTAGTCTQHQDPRRPGRTNITCEPDTHECDRLAVGAECHGYLRRPSHCREYTNDRNEHWRACMNDEATSPAPSSSAPSNTGNTPAATTADPNGDNHRVVAPQTSPASAGRRCSASPALPTETATVGVLAALAAATTLLARRRRRA